MPAQRIRQRKRKEALLKANTADKKSTQFNHIAPDQTRDASQPAQAFNVHACLDWEGFYINLSPIVLLVMLQLWAIMDTTTHPITTDSGAQLSGAINALAESAVELAPSWPFPDSLGFSMKTLLQAERIVQGTLRSSWSFSHVQTNLEVLSPGPPLARLVLSQQRVVVSHRVVLMTLLRLGQEVISLCTLILCTLSLSFTLSYSR